MSGEYDIKALREEQAEIAGKVVIKKLGKEPGIVAGVDAAFKGGCIIAAAVSFEYPSLTLVEEVYAVREVKIPYIPGLLAFREGPAVIEAIKKLKISPDFVLFDGQGIAHPGGVGIASHVGVKMDIPAIGVAKSRLIGDYEEPGPYKGDSSPLIYKGNEVGVVLRSRDNVRPLFVSPGHLVDMEGTVRLVLGCLKGFRLPEPTRAADRYAGRIKKEAV